MAHPIIIQESSLRNYLEAFREVIRPAQWRYFETVLMGLIHCQSSRTLSVLLRTVAGQLTRIAQLWGAIEELYKAHGSSAYLVERTAHQIEAIRTRLGEAAFSAAWDKGLTMTLNQAIDFAIELCEGRDEHSFIMFID